jgi:hypothetical protein
MKVTFDQKEYDENDEGEQEIRSRYSVYWSDDEKYTQR